MSAMDVVKLIGIGVLWLVAGNTAAEAFQVRSWWATTLWTLGGFFSFAFLLMVAAIAVPVYLVAVAVTAWKPKAQRHRERAGREG